jgi:LysR family transcriptional regulator, positive regulator for ilvC
VLCLHYNDACSATTAFASKEPVLDHYSLKLFLHLAQSLHFGKTSRACHISPSALSRQIQRMETEVGQRLFERDNRMVRLTRAGFFFQDYAKGVLEKWQILKDDLVQDQGTLKGEISIYCSVTASLSILPDLLSIFRASYPQVHIRLQTGDAGLAIKKVVEGEADIAVAALPAKLPKVLAFKILTQVSLAFIAPKTPGEFAKMLKGKIPWDKIPMILSEHGLARKKIDAWFKQKKIQPNIYAQVSGNEAILAMVSLGCGIGVVPGLAIENSPLKDRITILNTKPKLAPYDVGICIQKRKLTSRLVRAFWETGR